ncbi:hypothetical protein L5515_011035 [Caenorhabditis briggsae]|uniref:Carboxylesterase type B domain-containing protein n=1 Tax=Caenorhabditis briggsae TaxID=6238 RepID=A0AAE9JDX6_CAEBR|nr:hypothetical protein L5515_011035 [Caenorhabditis briggsae]
MLFEFLKIVFSLSFLQVSTSIIVITSYGKLNGKQIEGYHSFKHVPFAKPPIGKLRFQRPENPEKWTKVRNATEFGPACMSNSTVSKSPQKWIDEDCLHMNIFTSNKCLKSKDCAVVVYIHGGDILYNSAVMFNETFLMESFVSNDVVLVIPAFRLGIFSHFIVADQSIAPTNLAFYDILKSLHFVKTEIRNFGGNSKKVTLFGHSYGGAIVTMMNFSQRINQDLSLFQKTIVMSAQQNFLELESMINRTRTFAEHANCLVPVGMSEKMSRSKQDRFTMNCLQKKSGQELLRIQRFLEEQGYPLYEGTVQREPMFEKGKFSEFMDSPKMIPMLTGCTAFEMDDEQFAVPVAELIGFENPDECEAKYRRDLKNGIFERNNHSDETITMMVSTKLRINKLLEKYIPTYLYEFSYPKHSLHVGDLYYLMGLHPFEEDENEIHLKEVYRDMFMNFAKYGNPGLGFEMTDLKTSSYFDVNWDEKTGLRPQMKTGFEKKFMDYWLKDMNEYDQAVSKEKQRNTSKTRNMKSLPINEEFEESHNFLFSLLVMFLALSIVFLGWKTCRPKKRNLYIRIDGANFRKNPEFFNK